MKTYNTYNTYQEAKIENKDSEILKARDDWQGRQELIGKFIANKPNKSGGNPYVGEGYFEICNPADYCITVDQFLKDGHKFAIGDYVLDEFGFAVHLTCSTESWSKKDSVDSYRYVLRVSALEEKPKLVEWKNGDDCIYSGQPSLKCKFVSIHPNNNKCAIIWEGGGDINLSCVAIDCLSKPETPEQKAERERLEAAYDLYCVAVKANQDKVNSFDHFLSHKYKSAWLAVVDKTNYRKGGE